MSGHALGHDRDTPTPIASNHRIASNHSIGSGSISTAPEENQRMGVIAVCNQKGGVGKSTTVFHLARAAVVAGKRVLVVDLDPQGNLTSVVTKEPLSEDEVSLADALSARTSDRLRDVIVPGVWDGLDVAPTVGTALGLVRDELIQSGPGREHRLREQLAQVTRRYDLILIDCPPALDQLTINGLTAANGVLIVSQSKLWSANGIAHLLATIDGVQRHFNETLGILGVIINLHEAHTVGGRYWNEELHAAGEQRGFRIFDPPVPKRAVIADATEASRGLDEWGGADAAALATIFTDYLKELEGTS